MSNLKLKESNIYRCRPRRVARLMRDTRSVAQCAERRPLLRHLHLQGGRHLHVYSPLHAPFAIIFAFDRRLCRSASFHTPSLSFRRKENAQWGNSKYCQRFLCLDFTTYFIIIFHYPVPLYCLSKLTIFMESR